MNYIGLVSYIITAGKAGQTVQLSAEEVSKLGELLDICECGGMAIELENAAFEDAA